MKYNRRKRPNRQAVGARWIACVVLLTLIVVSIVKIRQCTHLSAGGKSLDMVEDAPEYDVDLLTINSYSRPGIAMDDVNGIVIHYTANPGSTAVQNRNYFEGLKDSHITKASAHFVVGLDGEIVQCIPTAEIAYASNKRLSLIHI